MLFVYLLLLVASASAKSYPHWWYDLELADLYFEDFKNTHDRHYESAEEHDKRFEIFKQNLIEVNQMNQEIGPNFGINKFSDLTPEEFSSNYLGFDSNSTVPMTKFVTNGMVAPQTLDWRTQNKVSPVKNQGTCGSCWSFSATGLLESLHLMKYNQLLTLSEQQLVDCDFRSRGCGGGFSAYALQYIQMVGGIEPDVVYPYKGARGQCRFNRQQAAIRVSNINNFQLSSDEDIKQALAQYGPLSIGIDGKALQAYTGQIFDCSLRSTVVNHQVLLVGYGTDHWIIKNSWGSWGENGYARIKMGQNPCSMKDVGFLTADLERMLNA